MRRLLLAIPSLMLVALLGLGERAKAEGASPVPGPLPPQAAPATAPPPGKFVPPKLKQFIESEPPATLKERQRVDVILTIDVDDKGQVQKVEVATSGGAEFDAAALAAAKQFSFEPATNDGKPVPVRITYRYRFLYKEPPPPAPPEPTPAPTDAPPPETPPPAPVPVGKPNFLGRVLSKGDRLAMPGVTVFLDEKHEVLTDDDGRFSFSALPVGDYKVKLRGAEIRPAEAKLKIEAGKQVEITYYVEAKQRYVTTVRAQRPVEDVIVRVLSQDEIKKIPGTQGDALKAVQNLPGVARAPFGGGLLVIWGSSPQDTRVYADGVTMPTLFHFGGLRSVINSEFLDSLVFMPGGYGVEYGRGMGGVIQVQTRRPKSNGYHGFVQLDLIDGSLLLEGPITKKLSFAISARRSWIDGVLSLFQTSDFRLTPVYYDYQAKLHYRPSPRDDVELFIFGSDDQLKLQTKNPDPAASAALKSHIYFHRLLVNWTHRFSNGATLQVIPSTGYDQPFQINGNFGNVPFKIDIRNCPWAVRLVLRQPINEYIRLDTGLDYEGLRIGFDATAPAAGPPREEDGGGGAGGATTSFLSEKGELYQNGVSPFIAANITLLDKKLLIVPQLRFEIMQWSGYAGKPQSYSYVHLQPEPRVNVRYQATKWMAIKAALGVYNQFPDPITFASTLGNPAVRPQTSYHYVLGFEFKPTSTLSIDAQVFYKDLFHLIVRGQTVAEPNFLNEGRGRVYGAEFLIKQQLLKGFYGWLSYTVLRSERKDHPDSPWRNFQFDQTHILTLIASYVLPRGFQVGLRFRYVTGNPTTPVTGAFYSANDNSYTPIYGPAYSDRLPAFHQLDVRLDKTWTFNRWKLLLYVDIQNVYNYRSAELWNYSYDYSQRQRVSGLPFLPVFGLKGEF